MKALAKIVLLTMLVVLITVSAHSQENLQYELNYKVRELYKQGEYSEATDVAKEALKVAENTFGPDHPRVATSLNNLGEVYGAQGRYAEAEPLYKRALAILEEALGSEHPEVARMLQNMVELYKVMGNKEEAERLEERIKIIRSKNQ